MSTRITRLALVALVSTATVLAQGCGSCPMQETATLTASKSKKDIVDTAIEAGQFKTLAAALGAADLVEALKGKGPFTVFAPTDAAFAKLPKGTVESLLKPENREQLVNILTYHVVSGDVRAKQVVKAPAAIALNGRRLPIAVDDKGVAVAGSRVTTTDIHCANGVIHVIDTVMLPESKNIVEIAAGNDTFSTLVAAVKAAGLVEALTGDGPFTVFAPTDAAFAKLPKGTVASLLKPENRDQLVSILKYHVVSGRVYSEKAVTLKSAKTLNGQSATIRVHDGKAMIDGATIVATDIDASNGVIHVIDSVILPR